MSEGRVKVRSIEELVGRNIEAVKIVGYINDTLIFFLDANMYAVFCVEHDDNYDTCDVSVYMDTVMQYEREYPNQALSIGLISESMNADILAKKRSEQEDKERARYEVLRRKYDPEGYLRDTLVACLEKDHRHARAAIIRRRYGIPQGLALKFVEVAFSDGGCGGLLDVEIDSKNILGVVEG